MKRIVKTMFFVAVSLFATNVMAQPAVKEPVGLITYSLPSTTLKLTVSAEHTTFFAGPYAKYAQKYLGIDVKQKNEVTSQVVDIKLVPFLEADQTTRYTVNIGKGEYSFLALTAQGLICTGDNLGGDAVWRFPSPVKGDFNTKGVTSNLTHSEATLLRNIKEDNAVNTVAVQQNMVVTKSLEARAKEAADIIINLRNKRYQLVTGDTDASYSGEAMQAVINELNNLEKEYLTLFIGYSKSTVQTQTYDVVPVNGTDTYIAFRLSQHQGLVPISDMQGKAYILKLIPQTINPAEGRGSGGNVVYYRIPAICEASIIDGATVLLQTRVPIYQMGIVTTFPIKK